MADPVKPTGSASPAASAPSGAPEPLELNPETLSDPEKYKDSKFRFAHRKMIGVIDSVNLFVNGDASVTEAQLQAEIKEWGESDAFQSEEDKKALGGVLSSLGAVKDPARKERANKVLAMLPGGDAVLKANAARAADAGKGKGAQASGGDSPSLPRDKFYNVGGTLQQDTFLLWLGDKIAPFSALATEKTYFAIKPTLEFPMGNQVGMARLTWGVFSSKGLAQPNGEPGVGHRFGGDFGLVDPTSDTHMRAGIGLEVDVGSPSAVGRLHFFKHTDAFPMHFGNWELGINSFWNTQDTYLPLFNDQDLLPPGQNTPFSHSSNLFAKNPFTVFAVSGRYYWKGRPEISDEVAAAHRAGHFYEGEGLPKVVSLVPSAIIMHNRHQDVAGFANDAVFFGTFWPMGLKASQEQFDTVMLGLPIYSLQDGLLVAGNAKNRADIWRYGDWTYKGLTLGLDLARLAWDVGGTAAAEPDPPKGQTVAEFQKNPGSVNDFTGRGHKIGLKIDAVEGALTALDVSNVFGNPDNPEDHTLYQVSGAIVGGVGTLGFLFSGILTGDGCASGTGILPCAFGGTKNKYFKTGLNTGPEDMASIENHYVLSTAMGGLASWGITRFLNPPSAKESTDGTPSNAALKKPNTSYIGADVHIGPQGVFVGARGTF